MTETRSLIDLVELLIVSGGLSPEAALRLSREIDALFGFSTSGRGSTNDRREKWRLKKERYRARKRAVSTGDKGGQAQTALIEEIPFTDLSLQGKERKSESNVSTVSTPEKVDKTKRAKRSTGDVLPDDWAPTENHYALGIELGFDRGYVDELASRLRNWAIANEHRAVARKSGTRGWNAAFSNWMKSHRDKQGGTNATNRNGHAAARPGGSYDTLAARVRAGRRERDAAGGESPDGRPDPAGGIQRVAGEREAPSASPGAHR